MKREALWRNPDLGIGRAKKFIILINTGRGFKRSRHQYHINQCGGLDLGWIHWLNSILDLYG